MEAFTLHCRALRVRVLSYGGIVAELWAPDRDGRRANVVLGCADLAGYEAQDHYLGALVGRYANRIAGGRFELDGASHALSVNEVGPGGGHHLHGGQRGFDKRVWRAAAEPEADGVGGVGVRLDLVSPAGDEGYPGTLRATVRYRLWDAPTGDGTGDGAGAGALLRIDCAATCDAPTVVNLTNHAYFNLAGEGSGSLDDHLLRVDADRYTPVDAALIPTGDFAPVAGTPLDLRRARRLGPLLRSAHPQIVRARGLDHNLMLNGPPLDPAAPHPPGGAPATPAAACLHEPRSGRTLELWTSEPGLQCYSGNALDGALAGTSRRLYRQGDGLALEAQRPPDAPNRPRFPSAVLRPGERYRAVTVWRFGVR